MPFMTDEDIKGELRKQKDDRDRIERLQGLVKHPGWDDYQTLLNVHIAARAAHCFEPLEDDSQSLRQEHNKGAVYGLIWSRDLPGVMLAIANEARRSEAADSEENE